MNIIKRILFSIPGLIKELAHLANKGARDFEMKQRFPKCIIDAGCSCSSDVNIGHNSHIHTNCIINHSQIGSYTYICRNALIQNTTIGNYCSISHDFMCGLGSHPLDHFSTSPVFL